MNQDSILLSDYILFLESTYQNVLLLIQVTGSASPLGQKFFQKSITMQQEYARAKYFYRLGRIGISPHTELCDAFYAWMQLGAKISIRPESDLRFVQYLH